MQSFSFRDAISLTSRFRKTPVRPTTTFRGNLELGELQVCLGVVCVVSLMLQIPVWAYIRQKPTPVPRFSKVSGLSKADLSNPDVAKVDREVTHHLHDENETAVEKEHLTKAYRYGKTLVPFLKTDEANMKLQTEKCLKVLAFVRSSKVK
jgi:ATP-dependent DNA helicase 2 subunit 2